MQGDLPLPAGCRLWLTRRFPYPFCLLAGAEDCVGALSHLLLRAHVELAYASWAASTLDEWCVTGRRCVLPRFHSPSPTFKCVCVFDRHGGSLQLLVVQRGGPGVCHERPEDRAHAAGWHPSGVSTRTCMWRCCACARVATEAHHSPHRVKTL